MAQQRSHVPKFGNWDGDNVPYTAYFENARKEKADGIRINPNDPEQNPEAFTATATVTGTATYNHQKHSRRTFSSESSSSNKSTPVLQPKHDHMMRRSNKSTSQIAHPPSPGPNYSADDFSYRSVSVPKFGQWEEHDPKSGEGFTVIFNKVKEEKQIAAAKFPPVPLQTPNNYQATQERHARIKKCCCLF